MFTPVITGADQICMSLLSSGVVIRNPLRIGPEATRKIAGRQAGAPRPFSCCLACCMQEEMRAAPVLHQEVACHPPSYPGKNVQH